MNNERKLKNEIEQLKQRLLITEKELQFSKKCLFEAMSLVHSWQQQATDWKKHYQELAFAVKQIGATNG